jgi:hypothetical protein
MDGLQIRMQLRVAARFSVDELLQALSSLRISRLLTANRAVVDATAVTIFRYRVKEISARRIAQAFRTCPAMERSTSCPMYVGSYDQVTSRQLMIPSRGPTTITRPSNHQLCAFVSSSTHQHKQYDKHCTQRYLSILPISHAEIPPASDLSCSCTCDSYTELIVMVCTCIHDCRYCYPHDTMHSPTITCNPRTRRISM